MTSKSLSAFFISFLIACFSMNARKIPSEKVRLFEASNKLYQYTGRIDISNPLKPRFWNSGVYIKASFKGTYCELLINDEVRYGSSHNYIEIVLDNENPLRIKLAKKENIIVIGKGLQNKIHHVTICKNTEALIGFLEFVGLRCPELTTSSAEPKRKIEFIGNSITCGSGIDISEIPCGRGSWYDQHNAWLSYGPVTARALQAKWQLTSVSGIGLIHSCCNMKILMPSVFDKVDPANNAITWEFKNYIPDVVTVCLGQNDGIQDSVIFCRAYTGFLKKLRSFYPDAQLICLSSPMADADLRHQLIKYLTAIVKYMNSTGDHKTHFYFFSRQFNHGCGGHPDLEEHRLIAAELTSFLKKLMKW